MNTSYRRNGCPRANRQNMALFHRAGTHRAVERREALTVAGQGVVLVAHGTLGEEQRQERPDPLHARRHAALPPLRQGNPQNDE